MEYEELKILLKELKKKGLKNVDVAKRMAISVGHLSDMANGRKPITEGFVKDFVAEFGELKTTKATVLPKGVKISAEIAILKILVRDFAKLKAELSKGELREEDIIKDIENRSTEVFEVVSSLQK